MCFAICGFRLLRIFRDANYFCIRLRDYSCTSIIFHDLKLPLFTGVVSTFESSHRRGRSRKDSRGFGIPSAPKEHLTNTTWDAGRRLGCHREQQQAGQQKPPGFQMLLVQLGRRACWRGTRSWLGSCSSATAAVKKSDSQGGRVGGDNLYIRHIVPEPIPLAHAFVIRLSSFFRPSVCPYCVFFLYSHSPLSLVQFPL